LQSRHHPCSEWSATVCAWQQSAEVASGQAGW
jgi:hypothetical protein